MSVIALRRFGARGLVFLSFLGAVLVASPHPSKWTRGRGLTEVSCMVPVSIL